MSKIQTKECPEIHLIEAYVTDSISSAEREKILRHLQSCRHCQGKAAELAKFYDILNGQDRKPIHSSVFKIVHDIEQTRINLTGILLHPTNQDEDLPYLSYQSEIVFSTQEENDAIDVEELDCIPVHDNDILIRAIQLVANNETTFYLFAHQENLYRNVGLEIKSIEKQFTTDDIGMVKIGCVDLADLDNQEVKIFPNS